MSDDDDDDDDELWISEGKCLQRTILFSRDMPETALCHMKVDLGMQKIVVA